MPDIRVTPLPQMQRRAPVQERVAAQRQNWGSQPAAVDSELTGLVNGLAVLNPTLSRLTAEATQEQDAADEKRAKAEAAAFVARADMQNFTADELAAQPAPSAVPPAYGPMYRETVLGLLGDRAGMKAKSDIVAQYQAEKDKEGFDPEAFFTKARQSSLAGFADPIMAAAAGRHINETEASLRNVVERDRMLKLEETTSTALAQKFEDSLRGDMSPERMFEVYRQELLPTGANLNKSKKDMTSFLLQRVAALSDKLGGRPDLFNVFEMQDETKTSLANYNRDLAPQIMSMRARAQEQMEKKLDGQAQEGQLKSEMELQELAKTNPAAITFDLLARNMGRRAAFKDHEEAVSFWKSAQANLDKQLAAKALEGNWEGRTMYDLSPEHQQKVMESKLGPYSERLKVAVQSGDQETIQQLAQGIMQVGSRANATVAFGPLARFTQIVSNTTPNPEGPDPIFKASAELYKAFSADPKFRDLYFKEDTAAVMKSYTRAVAGGTDPKAAYASAFVSISPEGKAAAEKYAASPEGKKAAEKAVKSVTGTTWLPTWLGGNPNVANNTHVNAWAGGEARDYMSKNPYASEADLADYLKSSVAANFVMDGNTGTAVRVPPALAGEATQQALTEYSKRLGDAMRVKDRSGADWKVQFRPTGTEGEMDIVLANGGREEHMGRLPLQYIVDAHRKEKMLSEEERGKLMQLRAMTKDGGSFNPALVEANRDLIAKARAINALPREVLQTIDERQTTLVRERLRTIPRMSFGTPDFSDLASVPQRGIKVDNKLTAQVAMKFATAPVTSMGNAHQSLAASLTTMGEAVMLQAYPDPAKDAGHNIGMGYNLKANAATAAADLLRAGVPDTKVQAVINGEAQITPEQASRLLMVALPRYEKTAMDAAEKTAPGLWAKMTPAQKAVMTDISYQVGSSEQFKKAWAALAAGDDKAFADSTKVYYTNKAGEKVEDKRRNSLRAAMLEGQSQWAAVVSRYGSFPSNPLEAMALNTQK